MAGSRKSLPRSPHTHEVQRGAHELNAHAQVRLFHVHRRPCACSITPTYELCNHDDRPAPTRPAGPRSPSSPQC